MRQPRIAIIDPAGPTGLGYGRLVARLQPLEVQQTATIAAGIELVGNDSFDIAVLTVRDGSSAVNLLDEVLQADPDLPVIVVDAAPDASAARACLRRGAADYLPLATADRDLEDALVEALTDARHRSAEQALRRAVERPYSFDDFIGESLPMRQVYSLIERVAASSVDVLITGETGTGKELVARAIHRRSRRADSPFVPIDCGAIPDALLESELFGHERGAFTGADARRIGLVEVADGGTLFLDEVAELPPALQAKLLRVLQERRVRRVGARKETPVDVRVVAATSRDVDAMVRDGSFRRDLYYRINVVRIGLPPLRQRGDDIGLLAEFFALRAGREMGREATRLSTDAYQVLRHYQWPGNVRELQNVIRRALALATGDVAGVDDLPDEIIAASGRQEPALSVGHNGTTGGVAGFFAERGAHVAQFERRYLTALLERHAGDVSAAAKQAKVPRGTLYRLLKSHDIDAARFRNQREARQPAAAD